MKRWTVVALAVIALSAGGWTALAWLPVDLPGPVAAVVHLPERLLTRWIPPKGGRLEGLVLEEQEAFRTMGRRLDGRIVWSSNRDGNHELYLVDLRAQTVRRLTDHPHVDFFSRFSPDGTKIVFLRSQRPWVSFRDFTAWDVYLLDLETDEERLLAKGGYHPTWAPDGEAIVFLRQKTQVIRLDLATRQESLLLDGTVTEGILGGLETPELSPDGTQLALTVRSRRYDGVGLIDLASKRLTRLSKGQACQLTWMPDQRLVWVDPKGRGGTRLLTLAGPG